MNNQKRTIPACFFDSADKHSNLDAIRWKENGAWKGWTYAELGARVNCVAKAIVASGIQPRESVAIFAANGPGWYVADLATLAVGGVSVPIYATSSSETLQFILNHSETKLVFVSDGSCADALGALHLKGIQIESLSHMDAFITRGEVISDDNVKARWRALREDDLATIIYTSGTTGEPKGVMLSHKNIVSNCEATKPCFNVHPGDGTLAFLPLSHALERTAGMFLMLFRGVTISIAEDLTTIASNLLEVRPTILVSVPRVLEKFHAKILEAVSKKPRLLRRMFDVAMKPRIGRGISYWFFDLLFFRKIRGRLGGRIRMMVSGGAALSPEIGKFFMAIGIPVLEGYGLTETSPVISVNRLDQNKIGTVGLPLPGVDVKIAEDGEILARGDNVMKAYFKNPDATAEVIDSAGWFHTGDIGEIDTDGFLKITDRKKDLIVTSGGKKVAPQAIENDLKLHPLIAHVAVLGDGQKYIAALIVPDFDVLKKKLSLAGIAETESSRIVQRPEVRQWIQIAVTGVNSRRAPFEQVKRFELVADNWSIESGELTPTMKMKRKAIAARYADLIRRIYEEKK